MHLWYLAELFLGWKKTFQRKFIEKKHIPYSLTFSRKWYRLRECVEKYSRAGQATEDMCRITRDTCKMSYFATAAVVTRMCLCDVIYTLPVLFLNNSAVDLYVYAVFITMHLVLYVADIVGSKCFGWIWWLVLNVVLVQTCWSIFKINAF
jgi:hypothetical protein